MTFSIKIGAHRGMGCTDSNFAKQRNGDAVIPLENTLPSFAAALLLADFIETDLISTKDSRIVLTHSTDFSQHVTESNRPTSHSFISDMNLNDIRDLRLGEDGRGRIPTLQELFALAQTKTVDRETILNLELKDVQGTGCKRRESPNLSELTLQEIERAGFPLECIRFSSFSLDSVQEMAEASKEARLGMLFDLPQSQGGDVGKPIFVSGDECYLSFTPESIKSVLRRVPALEAVHPEIQSLADETVRIAADHNLSIATWGWLERSPLKDETFAAATMTAVEMCSRHEVALEIITDHIVDMRAFLKIKGYGGFIPSHCH